MTKFTDNTRTVQISMTDKSTGCDWEHDFFQVGSLSYDEEKEAYIVDDVDYLIDQAKDYIAGTGDFAYETPGSETSTLNWE